MSLIESKIVKAKTYFKNLEVSSKDQSKLMKIIGLILFFNPYFKQLYTTTIGNTIYFPHSNYIKNHPITSLIILIHELVHIYDKNKIGLSLFTFLYLFPQSCLLFIFPITILLGIFFSWWWLFLLVPFLLPLPAYFRKKYELRGYLVSLYVMHRLNVVKNYQIDLNVCKDSFIKQFKNGSYYFMWMFNSINNDFEIGLKKIKNNEKPFFEPQLFKILDQILEE